ncbi:MAG: amino acid ABC transporter permease [Desulfohalobiaceae bacterium]|nr:amino acid ABC transporter permease [Desulfohalobiaceae bacterium]
MHLFQKTRFRLSDGVILGTCLAILAYYLYQINVGLGYEWGWEKIPQFFFRYDAEQEKWVSNIIMRGVYNTLRLSFWGILLASLFGTLMGICRSSRRLFLRLTSGTYVELMRNIPPLVIIYIVYFFIGDQILPGLRLSDALEQAPPFLQELVVFFLAEPHLLTSFLAAILTISIFEGAYITEIVRSGIQSIDPGQLEAASALGMSKAQQLRHIILPQAFQRILPPLAGQFIALIKDSSIVSVISIPELTFQGTELMAGTLLTMEIWITITALYLAMTLPCSLITERLEIAMSKNRGLH